MTGRTWERESSHPYFGRLVYFGHRDAEKAYWEAEFTSKNGGAIGITFSGTPDGPDASEEAFCRVSLQDERLLLARCKDAFASEYEAWTGSAMPDDFEAEFVLDGISLPQYGDPKNDWKVCYFCPRAKHYFTAYFQRGEIDHVVVDG